jgi:arsenate reductase
MPEKLNILFLCTGNSCRSQMAQGWTNHLKADRINAVSAGIETHGLNPDAVAVMAEAGVDISDHRSRHIDEFKDRHFDYVITVCGHAHENCPWFPGPARVIHVGFDDPPKRAAAFTDREKQLDCYRKIRDEIKKYVLTLPDSLNVSKKG